MEIKQELIPGLWSGHSDKDTYVQAKRVFCADDETKARFLFGLLRRHGLRLHSGVRVAFLTLRNNQKAQADGDLVLILAFG